MESSEMYRKAIELGKQLVEQLSDDERADTLSQWVAHYIAEQIVLASQTTGEAKKLAEERCFHSILTLWSNRQTLPNGFRPLEEFEPILNALGQLDPDNPQARYHTLNQSVFRKTGEASEVVKIVEFIFGMDRSARVLIDFALKVATAQAVKPETKIYLSEAIPNSPLGNVDLIRELLRRHGPEELSDGGSNEANVRLRQQRIDALREFCRLSQEILEVLESAPVEAPEPPKPKRKGSKKQHNS